MNRSKMHAPADPEARLAEGISWRVGWYLWIVVFSVGCSGCYQQTVVPPTTSISPPMRPAPVIPQPMEPLSPPSSQPLEPIIRNNPWKPDSEVRDWNYIVLHHTAASSGSLESIHEEHLKRKDKSGNSWLGIGYHFVIGNGKGMPDGEIEPTFRWRQQMQGAHAGVAEYNQHGIGIVLIGNFENDPPTAAQKAATKKLVSILKREYGIKNSKIVGHGDVKATECPGKHFPMSEVRDNVAATEEFSVGQVNSPFKGADDVSHLPVILMNSKPSTITSNHLSGDSRK